MNGSIDYRLALDKTAAGLEATWILPDEIGARFALAPGLTAEDLAEHRWYLEEYLVFPGPGDHARARAFEQRLETFGAGLYQALFHEGVDVLRDLVRGTERRLLTIRSNDADALALPLALLEACQTADLSGAPVFGSVAPALLKSGVSSVLAFSHSVLVSSARILVERFYEALCGGESIGAALNEGRRALRGNPVRGAMRSGDLTLRDWHIAQLYQAGGDPVLVSGGVPSSATGSAPLQRGREPGKELGVAPMYGFLPSYTALCSRARDCGG
jgi:hypothetical protein